MFFNLILLPLEIGFAIAYFYLANEFLRLESLVQRRLLLRFDRVNRKVHLHRPRYAGGVITLDWDKVTTAFDGKDEGSVGIPQLLWYPQDTPNGLIEMLLVGRLARADIEIRQRWEFIRRFMQESPQSLPARPKTIGRFSWPWRSVQTASGLLWPFHGPDPAVADLAGRADLCHRQLAVAAAVLGAGVPAGRPPCLWRIVAGGAADPADRPGHLGDAGRGGLVVVAVLAAGVWPSRYRLASPVTHVLGPSTALWPDAGLWRLYG
ncbi:hypothetical protein N8I74_04065 [Chitiniphilus purpureus]|uniref:Uncharacterized protein n=1 Tax=Chitiniphilus purpureus TaxID=2981137 RepID=A0ABY6DPA7_9NEIS|nr:hypothetical protein [Chitiniphilus sp. CD1]UXY16205.1 hypothetical protein N8I74_04065 [Chitiniphilus sp. CD1]